MKALSLFSTIIAVFRPPRLKKINQNFSSTFPFPLSSTSSHGDRTPSWRMFQPSLSSTWPPQIKENKSAGHPSTLLHLTIQHLQRHPSTLLHLTRTWEFLSEGSQLLALRKEIMKMPVPSAYTRYHPRMQHPDRCNTLNPDKSGASPKCSHRTKFVWHSSIMRINNAIILLIVRLKYQRS